MSVLDSVRADNALSFDRGVARRYVHRWAVSEVFLTDLRVLDDRTSWLAAMLPTAHAYYGDHTGPGGLVDSMAVMECARQAATYLAHEGLGVPLDSAFLVASWGLRLTGEAWPYLGSRPGRLSIEATVDRTVRRGVVRGAEFEMRLWLDGRALATVDIDARYTPAAEAELVRRYRRASAPPFSDSLPAVPPGRPVAPAAVHRSDPANVVLFDVATAEDRTTARIGTRPTHRGFYDHPQDHYTAMILMEAARQMGLLVTGGADGPPRAVTAYAARFHQFAELDAPVVLDAPTPAGAGPTEIPVLVRQGDDVVSEIVVTVAPEATR
ncbi:AfsA-related hotdog domain-containing protein [Krasilnikovia sp. MM14-A1259]|uniref:AfsA-related hotdog domain-containing protein n=1 Tax=Krasilnikovia sp. MM14-A1259 TaxID=3373539 RepID=UPI0038223B6B